MKKMILGIFSLVVFMSFTTTSSALANEKLLNYATTTHLIAGEEYKLSNSNILKIERYLNQNEVSDSEADEIISKLSQIVAILNTEGTSDVTKLSKAKKEEIFNLASAAANVVGAKITYNNTNKTIVIYDQNGTKIDEISLSPYLKYTGSNNMIYAISGIAVLVSSVIIYRKSKNA